MKIFRMLFVLVAITLAGCSAVGPPSVHHDRFDYNRALSDSWKEQTLLNIVRLRYADMPIFLEVASIVSGYTLEGSVNLAGTLSSESAIQGDFLSVGTGGKFTDRPTITYSPVTGEKFHKSFMTPIPPKLLLYLMESGWSAEMVMPLTVDAINGLRSRKGAGKYSRTGTPDFYRVIRLMSEVKESGSMAFRIVKGNDNKETIVLFFYTDEIPSEVGEQRNEIIKLLNLSENQNQITVKYGLLPQTEGEIAILTRSMLQMMISLSTLIEVPEDHVKRGLTPPIENKSNSEEEKLGRLIRIESGLEKPEKPFVSVKYLDHWFWINEDDFASKRTFTFLMLLFSMMENEEPEGLPLITIPAG
ncbi:MAG: hypothetical protein ACI8PB_005339 [Desulforhopalus sp.]|jgi:hypothetical protein